MRKILVAVAGIALMGSTCFGYAADAKVTNAGGNQHPCHAIMDACKKAGFVKGGAKSGKGIYANCLQPLLHGKTVKNVTVSNDAIAACKKRKMSGK